MTIPGYTPRIPESTQSPRFWTYQDAVEWLLDYYGRSKPSERDLRLARRAVDNAMRRLTQAHPWRWYNTQGTVYTDPSYREGTIAYDHATRTVTLTGGTWPASAAWGSVRLGFVICRVAQRISDTELLLSPSQNPGKDIEAGSAYEYFRDTYPLPPDFNRMADPFDESFEWGIAGLVYIEPSAMHRQTRWEGPLTASNPVTYTIDRDQRTGGMAIVFGQPPSEGRAYAFHYVRRPRPLLVYCYASGSASVTADSVEVAGTDTTWTSQHAGCVLRMSEDGTLPPTSQFGSLDGINNPPALTRFVADVTDTNAMVLDAASDVTLENVRYCLSDPLDIDIEVAGSFFQRAAEYEFALVSADMKDVRARGVRRDDMERERMAAQAADNCRTTDVQPPPWLNSPPGYLIASIKTEFPVLD